MYSKINKDLASAMKAGDKLRLETLRMMKSKILNVNARGDLPEKEIIKILKNYAKTLKESIDIMSQHNRIEEADKIKKELAIVGEYFPKSLSEEETKAFLVELIKEIGAASKKDMGRVMKEALSRRSDADGDIVRKIVMEILP